MNNSNIKEIEQLLEVAIQKLSKLKQKEVKTSLTQSQRTKIMCKGKN